MRHQNSINLLSGYNHHQYMYSLVCDNNNNNNCDSFFYFICNVMPGDETIFLLTANGVAAKKNSPVGNALCITKHATSVVYTFTLDRVYTFACLDSLNVCSKMNAVF